MNRKNAALLSTGILLALAGTAQAESNFVNGTSTLTANARVDFQVTIPKFLSLRVGSANTTIDLVNFAVTATDVGSGTDVAGTGGDLGAGTVTARVSLNPVLTIGYQIAEVLTTHLKMSRKDALDRSVELLRLLRIPAPEVRVKEYPHQLSGGMRQRVMIAMSIACDPGLLIADEPTTALDVTIQAQILELIQGIREEKKMSILFITHDLGIIAENASRVGIMYAGRLVALADTREIFNKPKHPYTMGLLDSIPKRKGTALKRIAGIVPRPEDLPEGCKFMDRCRYASGMRLR